MRRPADVNVRTCGCARNGRAKGQEWNAVGSQKIHQRLAFGAVRVQRDVHRVPVIQAPTVVNWSLAKVGYRQLFLEGIRKESLNLPRFG